MVRRSALDTTFSSTLIGRRWDTPLRRSTRLSSRASNAMRSISSSMKSGSFSGRPLRSSHDSWRVIAPPSSANPEDYTARGKIITPLKDRIGSEIGTHYPHTVELGGAITRQESWLERNGRPLKLPDFMLELIERIAFRS